MSEERSVIRFLYDGRHWLSQVSRGVVAGGQMVATESDRWFMGALRGLEGGAAHAQRGIDAAASAVAVQWIRRRPSWMRRRTPRERIERALSAEAKRYGFDPEKEEFRSFSGKIAVLLELVYTGAVPLDAIAFEAGDTAPGADVLHETPVTDASQRSSGS
jgi:hypothetical protein